MLGGFWKTVHKKIYSQNELINGEGWIYCERCDYKCYKQNTMTKHVKKKHNQVYKCYIYGEMFKPKIHLNPIRKRFMRRKILSKIQVLYGASPCWMNSSSVHKGFKKSDKNTGGKGL